MTTVEGAAGETGAAEATARRRRVPRLRRRDGRAPLLVELAVIAWLFWLYDVVNNFAPTRVRLAQHNAYGLLSLERSLHVDVERALNHWLSGQAALAFVATYWYFFAHVLVTFAVLAAMWWRDPPLYRRMRTPLVFVNLIAFAVFWRYPLAPPRMLSGLGFRDVVASTHAVISWDSGALVHDADQLAAMPSLHIAWASWSALCLWRMVSRRGLRVLIALYPPVTAVIVVATGNHYVIDVLAGAATFALGLAIARAVAWVTTPRVWFARRPPAADCPPHPHRGLPGIAAHGLGPAPGAAAPSQHPRAWNQAASQTSSGST